jgi:hypothetical protein
MKFIKKILLSELFLMGLVLIGAFLVRLYKINTPLADWHSWRQADTASVSRIYLERGIKFLYPRYQDISSIQTGIDNPNGYRFVEFPIYNAVHAVLVKTFPVYSLEVWGRLLSIFCSLTTTFLIFLLGKRFIGHWGALTAAFFFAFIPYSIFYSRVILPEPMAVMFGVLALWLFVKYIDSEKYIALILSGIAFSLSLLVKPFTIFFAVPMIYLTVKKYSFKKIFIDAKVLIRMLVFTCISLVPFLLWRYWLTLFPVGVPFFTWAFNGDGIRFRPAFWRWIFGERLGRLILGFWGLVPFALGAVTLQKNSHFVRYFLLGIFLYVSVIATANVRHDYYQIFTIPAICLALGAGANYLLTTKELVGWLAKGLLGFSTVMMIGMGWYQVRDYYNINHPEIIAAGEAVDRLTPKDALVVAPYSGDTAFLYQTKRSGWPAVDNSIDNIIFRGADYFVSVNYDSDTSIFIKRFATVEATDQYIILDLHKEIK